jgi:geranylgeranylglycerol-phosphate geranylgeranyltransferase
MPEEWVEATGPAAESEAPVQGGAGRPAGGEVQDVGRAAQAPPEIVVPPGTARATPPSFAPGPFSIVRPGNLVMAAAGVAIGGLLALGRAVLPDTLLWAMASAAGLGAAGNVANDLFDLEADRINRPFRPLVTGKITRPAALLLAGVAGGLGLWAAWWVSWTLFWLGLAALLVLLGYSPFLKPRGLLGNFAVAVVASMPLVYGAAAVGSWQAGLVPAVLAAFLHLARELVKDLEDVPGDLAIGRATLPIAWGADAGFTAAAAILTLFVPIALVPWAVGWYGWRYGLPVMALDGGVLLLVSRLLDRRLAGVRAGLKAAMVVGLFALLWDRL